MLFRSLSPQERNEALYALEKLIHLPEAASIKGEIATTVARIYFYSRNWDMAREWYERTFAIKPFLPDLYFDIKKNLRYFRPEDLSVYRSLLARSKTPAPTLLQKKGKRADRKNKAPLSASQGIQQRI